MHNSPGRKAGPQQEITWACVDEFTKFPRETECSTLFMICFTSSTAKNPILSRFAASSLLKAAFSNFS